MSARDIPLSGSALADTLNEILANIGIIERRVSWPGAVRSAVAGASGPWASGGHEATGPFASQTILTLTVDPGRWIFFSNLSMALVSTSAFDYPPGGLLTSVLTAVDPSTLGTRSANLSTGLPGTRRSAMTNVLSVSSPNAITATLTAAGNYNIDGYPGGDPTGTYSVSSAILIAFPA